MTQAALLSFAIGPVQDFIASARSTRDLWTGSYILSFLAGKAYGACLEAGAQPVYPLISASNVLGSQTAAVYPNKFSIRLEYSQAEKVAFQAEQAVRQVWQDIAKSVHDFLTQLSLSSGWDAGWPDQINSLLEFYWVCVPLDEAGNELAQEQEQAGLEKSARALDARKKLRNFTFFKGDSREKDSLDGLFEQMGPLNSTRSENNHFWEQLREKISNQPIVARLAKAERLSAPNLTKRFAWDCYFRPLLGQPLPMFSTSDIATAAWKAQVITAVQTDSSLRNKLEQYLATLQPLLREIAEPGAHTRFEQIDGYYFYPESLVASSGIDGQWTERAINLARPARPRLREFLEELVKFDPLLASPPRYYAALFLDVDQMGQVITGHKTAPGQPARHPSVISQELAEYAKVILKVVEQDYQGTVIYTGGDDSLVLLPPEHLLACAVTLAAAFPLAETTISMGAVIAHHKQPLQKVLELGRAAEQQAKLTFERNALVINLLKRSGETVMAGSHWNESDRQLAVFTVLDELRQHFLSGHVSVTLPYRLRQEILRLETDDKSAEPTHLLVSEFKRVFARQSQPAAPAGLQEVKEKLAHLAGLSNFRNFVDLLVVTAFLARRNEE